MRATATCAEVDHLSCGRCADDALSCRLSIERYHKLLDTGPLDEGRRRTVETLLGEEEAKLAKGR
jgi:hypothetical protein